MTDIYDYWRKALAGENPPIHDGDFQAGFYRKKNKPFNGQMRPDDPVAIYPGEDGAMIARVGPDSRAKIVDPAEVWTWVADKPVSYEAYKAAAEQGVWEQEVADLQPIEEAAGIGHNNAPDDPFEAFTAQIEAATKLADEALGSDTETDEQSDKLVNLKDRILQLHKEADDARKAEKKPHDDAGKAVQAKWKPLLEQAEKTKKKLLARITDFLRRQEQKAAKEALERAKEAEAKGEELPVLQPQRAQAGGKVSGRKTSLRTRKSAVVSDPEAFAAWLIKSNNPDLMDTLQTIANRIATSGAEAPGVEVKTEKVAA